ncbi:MAG: class I SAM-dependent methyltransferase, partial [Dehalococcoidia bacterium]
EMLDTQVRISCDSLYRHPAVYWLLGDSLHPGGLDLTGRLAEKLGLSGESLVLDVATGRGTSPRYLAKEVGCTVIGVDLVQESLSQARKLSVKENLTGFTDYFRGDAEALPIATGSVDAVICECSFSIFPDKVLAAQEMARVLKPGGVVGISDVTCITELPEILQGALARVACLADVRNPSNYRSILAEAGFQGIEIEDQGDKLEELASKVKKKLAPLRLMLKLGSLRVPGLERGAASKVMELLTEVEGLIHDRTLSYCLITARKPL